MHRPADEDLATGRDTPDAGASPEVADQTPVKDAGPARKPTPQDTPAPATAPAPLSDAIGRVTKTQRTVRTSVGAFTVQAVTVPTDGHRIKVALATDQVGATEPLAAMALRHRALVAINGSFFDAYSDKTVRNPHGTLISGAQIVHISDHPAMIGMWPDGRVRIGQARFRVVGSLDGSEQYPNDWYAYGINDLPSGSTWSALYSPLWAAQSTPDDGAQIVVRSGKIARIGRGKQSIPEDGFVIHLRGKEKYLSERFRKGRQCSYRVAVKWSRPSWDWAHVVEGLGCGPSLLRDGQVTVDPAAEGFRDPKILSGAGARSAVGLTEDGRLLLVTCPGATIKQLGHVMKGLQAVEAMNLDGGASSCLWYDGRYLTEPGRDISNALLVLPRRG